MKHTSNRRYEPVYDAGDSSRARTIKRVNPHYWTESRRSVIVVALCACLGLVIGIAWWRSPLFHINTVKVHISGSLLPKEREAILQEVQLRPGVNYWAMDTSSLSEKVASNPWVESVRVLRNGLNHIQVDVKSRTPAFALQVNEGTFEADVTGRIIRGIQPSSALFVLHPPKDVLVKPGGIIGFAGWKSALKLSSLKDRLNALPLKFARVDPGGDLCLNMIDSMEIRLGRCDKIEEQLSLVERLYRANPQIGLQVAVLDVRFPTFPSIIDRKKSVTIEGSATAIPANGSVPTGGDMPSAH